MALFLITSNQVGGRLPTSIISNGHISATAHSIHLYRARFRTGISWGQNSKTHWELRGYRRKPGRPRKNWVDVIKRNLRQMDLTWEEGEELANDKAELRQRVAQCSHLDVG